ncbi:MAG TPA: glycosyltransferase, partial [Bacteroidales bacterium]|nr:glycosyltransferase [Bacteroidales bacterium]
KIDKRTNINAYLQFEKILARYKKQLISYSVDDVERLGLVSESNPKPILIGNKTSAVNKFISENIIFLQPTRIISRKRIELGFNLLLKMIENPDMNARFLNTPHLKITLMISGPVASGNYQYYLKLIKRFRQLLFKVPEHYRNRIYLALLLGELDKESFRERFTSPIGIPELYNISSLILLPSKTEGRGLPIIEATACGTPIFCRRYDPEEVYSEVIGEHLREEDRLLVYEFRGKKISKKIVERIINRVFFPHNYASDTIHNKNVVMKRYSLEALNENMQQVFTRLYFQLQKEYKEKALAESILKSYRETTEFRNDDLIFLVNDVNRQYLPGYGKLSFMLMLKSLIDPSFFRTEQQMVRGMLFYFAKECIENIVQENLKESSLLRFYNTVHQLFQITDGDVSIRHDHSMSYRHRNNNYYPYQDYTFQELTGIVNLLYLELVSPRERRKVELSPQFFTDWNLALLQLSASNYLAIDNRNVLIEKLQSNLPIAYFPGQYIMYELEFFALQALRSRLKLPIEKEVSKEILIEKASEIAPVYIFAQQKKLGRQLNKEEIIEYIREGGSNELKLLLEYKLVRIISTQQTCVGIHFAQLGEEPLRILRLIREQGGFLLTNRRHAALMTDIVNIDRFHVGRVRADFAANIMGIPVGSGYIQYVPAGLRTTLAYPTPVQTAKDFDEAFKSEQFCSAVEKFGYENVMKKINEDAGQKGSPVMHVIETMVKEEAGVTPVKYNHISGLYEDGHPYSGIIAKLCLENAPWDFSVISTKHKPKTVWQFVRDFEKSHQVESQIAWNGGYILNPELVGKLGLPESFIGSPLGLIITHGDCISPPLFNKAALIISREGKADIQQVNCSEGLFLKGSGDEVILEPQQYNPEDPGNAPAFYDLMYSGKFINGDGRIFIRLSGNIIKEVIHTSKGEEIAPIPVGLTISFPPEQYPSGFVREQALQIQVPGLENALHAVEAGPMLVDQGKNCIDMEIEGWKTA